ncbi:MAG TPA: AAA family ATPase [Gammaproteobacteria bacterium]
MYADYFGLDEAPFAITPDPRYLYLGRRHAEALAHLLYGIREGGGFVLLTGEVGTGKTTLTRCLLDELPQEVDVAVVLNPRLDVTEFLEAICQELHIPLPEGGGNRRLVDALNRYLLDAHARGRRTVLIVDEAQNLSADVLEQVRLLTNLETAKTKLLQIVLIGQPELREIVALPELRQLAQRITARYHLEPLERSELRAYIAHRLAVAGARGPIFGAPALKAVWKHSAGIPRRVNILCDRALLGAWSADAREVSPRMVHAAAREIATVPQRAPRGRAVFAGIVIAAGVLAAFAFLRPGSMQPEVISEVTASPPRAPDLSTWLQDHAATAGTDHALEQLFAQWRLDYQPGGAPACEQAADAGLRCLFERGTWRGLEELNRPAVLALTDSTGRRYQLTLTGVLRRDGKTFATVHAGPASRQVGAIELTTLWPGEYLALWQPPQGVDGPLGPGSQGPAVAWLRAQLAPGADTANPEIYDSALAERVREFQAREGLRVDGIAGERTLLRLRNLQREPGIPFLDEASH